MLVHFAAQAVRDLARTLKPVARPVDRVRSDDEHLRAAMTWLQRSIDACGGNGSSKGYRVGQGWMPPYRETSGYLIPTLLRVAASQHRPDLGPVADRIGDWLASVQRPDGGFSEQELGREEHPVVFNTGQILHGFNALVIDRGRSDLVGPARRAGEFLLACMDASGSFVRNTSHGIVHAYNVRTAWALYTLGTITGDARYTDGAVANADWTLRQQTDQGFFRRNQFKPGGNPNTHGIAYVLQGLLEISLLSGERRFADAVRRCSERIVSIYGAKRRLVAEIGEAGEFLSDHICLTGLAQLAIVQFRLYALDGDRRHLNTGLNLLDEVAASQNVLATGSPHCGAIKGSEPIWGRYAPLQYPNWATKFFVDALLTKQEALNRHEDSLPVQLPAG